MLTPGGLKENTSHSSINETKNSTLSLNKVKHRTERLEGSQTRSSVSRIAAMEKSASKFPRP
jgi:hypothetical protein